MVSSRDLSSSSSSSLSSQCYRILEVKLNSASLNSKNKKKAKRYVKLWIHPDLKLQTKIDSCNGGSKQVWDEKFVFAIPEDFLNSRNSCITFEIYRVRKFFKDSLIGKSVCKVGELNFDKQMQEFEKECKYDTETESNDGSFYNLYEEGDDSFYSVKEDDNDDDDDDDEEEREKPEMKARVRIPIMNGLKVKGELDVEMGVWKGNIDCVGKFKSQNWGMKYEEFMGQLGDHSVKMKQCWLCYVSSKTWLKEELNTRFPTPDFPFLNYFYFFKFSFYPVYTYFL